MANKPKLEVLDALRGFCALVVVALHFSENYTRSHGFRPLPHGCLPVEFFFILTGFMLIYAYDHRWAQGMTVRGFLARRAVRLHPLVIVGSIVGAACYLLSAEQYANRFPCELGLGQLGLLTLWCCTMLPAPSLLGWRLLAPLQGPLWTLFYIYLANILYALVLRRLRTWMIIAIALAAIGATWYFGIASGGFHSGAEWSWWPASGPTLKSVLNSTNMRAFARLAFPLFAGMAITRRGWKITAGNWSLPLCLLILSAIFCAPEMRPGFFTTGPLDSDAILSALGLSASKALNGGFEAAAVVIGMPIVLLLGVGGEIRNRRLAAVCNFLGRYSFPLYCTHYPFTILQRVWRDAHPDAPWQMHFATVCACALFAFTTAYVAMLVADWSAKKLKRWT